MAVYSELHIFSSALGKMTEVNVILPQPDTEIDDGVKESERKKESYKCLYLLHGLSDDNTAWERYTEIEKEAEKRNIAVVMPDGAKSFYANMRHGEAYYDYIAKELPQLVRAIFPISAAREDNYIAGLSMGGYGAMKIALKNPGSYCAAAALSPVADVRAFENSVMDNVFGGEIKDDEDIAWLAEHCKSNRPRIYTAIGTSDFLYEMNKPLRRKFEELKYDYKYEEGEGSHTWQFWNEYIKHAMDWMLGK